MLGSRASTSVFMSAVMFRKSGGARPMGWWGRGLWLMSGRVWRGGVCAGAGESGAMRAWVWIWWCRGMDCSESVMIGWGCSWEMEIRPWAAAMWFRVETSDSACLLARLQFSGLSVISLSSSSAWAIPIPREEKRQFNPFVQAGPSQNISQASTATGFCHKTEQAASVTIRDAAQKAGFDCAESKEMPSTSLPLAPTLVNPHGYP